MARNELRTRSLYVCERTDGRACVRTSVRAYVRTCVPTNLPHALNIFSTANCKSLISHFKLKLFKYTI